MALADAVGIEPWQREALDLACRWHDIGRVHDGADYYHGALSAGKVVGLRLHEGVDSPVLAVALACVMHHSGEEHIHAREAFGWLPDSEQSWAVFRILKDADALDRVRLGPHDLDPSFLRFDASHERIQVAWELLSEIPCGWLPGDVSGG